MSKDGSHHDRASHQAAPSAEEGLRIFAEPEGIPLAEDSHADSPPTASSGGGSGKGPPLIAIGFGGDDSGEFDKNDGSGEQASADPELTRMDLPADEGSLSIFGQSEGAGDQIPDFGSTADEELAPAAVGTLTSVEEPRMSFGSALVLNGALVLTIGGLLTAFGTVVMSMSH